MTIDDAEALNAMRLAKWYLATNKRLRCRAMRCGGFNEVISFAMIGVLRYSNPKNYKLSTVVINSVRFALGSLDESASRLKRASYESINLSGIESYRDITNESINRLIETEAREAIYLALTSLKDRQRDVIKMRYFEGLTLEEVADKFGVTRERIRQIENSAVRQLQQPSLAAGMVSHCSDYSVHATDAIDERFEKLSKMTLRECVDAGLLRQLA